jgi:hypothetical protein
VMNGVSPDRTASMLLDQGFGTPAASEPLTGPNLQPVTEPEPPAAAPQADDPPSPLTRISGASTVASVQPKPSKIPVLPTAEAAAGVLTVFAVAATLVARGRRRLSVGAHSQRG